MAVHYWYLIRDMKRWNACFRDQGHGSDTTHGTVPTGVNYTFFTDGYFRLLQSEAAREGALVVKIEIEEDYDFNRIRMVDEYMNSLREIEGEKL